MFLCFDYNEMRKRSGMLLKERQSRPTSCIVCRDSAAGYNYGAPSCNSCKAFFRRAVVKKEVFPDCARFGVCLTIVTGLPCRSCRYNRCISGGMSPHLVNCTDITKASQITKRTESVESSEGKLSAPESIESQIDMAHESNLPAKTRRSTNSTDVLPFDSPSRFDPPEIVILMNPVRIESKLEIMMQSLIEMEGAHQRLRMSSYAPQLYTELCIDDFLPGPSKLGEKFEVMYAVPYEPTAMSMIPIEVIINNRVVMELPNFDYSTKKLWPFQDVVYSIEFIKAHPIYHLLEKTTQRTLLASALLYADFTTAFYSYSHNSARTYYPDGSVMSWSKELQQQSPGSARFHVDLIAAMREADLNIREYTLLKNIIICNPMLDDIHPCDISILQNERERCAKTLFAYVLTRRGPEKGPKYFASLLSIMDIATKLTSWQKSQHILAMAMGLYKIPAPFVEAIFHSN